VKSVGALPPPIDKIVVLTRASWDGILSYDNLSRIVPSNGCMTYVNPVSMRADCAQCAEIHRRLRGTDSLLSKSEL
jgi:hypothetical protein